MLKKALVASVFEIFFLFNEDGFYPLNVERVWDGIYRVDVLDGSGRYYLYDKETGAVMDKDGNIGVNVPGVGTVYKGRVIGESRCIVESNFVLCRQHNR